MPSFSDYLKSEIGQGRIDFSLRAHIKPCGTPAFYIHPQDADGETADFEVIGSTLIADRDARPAPTHEA